MWEPGLTGTLLILGAGGHALVVAETALSGSAFSHVAFLDDNTSHPAERYSSVSGAVLGPLALALEAPIQQHFEAAFVAIGDASIRLNWLHQLKQAGYDLPAILHPHAWISPSAVIGPGSVICANAAVQANAQLGVGVIANTGCSIDHDVVLADGVHICPGAHLAGHVHVGACSWIGIGASVIQQVRIGSSVTVGAGAAVVHDLPNMVTAVGVPARILPKPFNSSP